MSKTIKHEKSVDDQAAQDFVIMAAERLLTQAIKFKKWAVSNFSLSDLTEQIEDLMREVEHIELIGDQVDEESWSVNEGEDDDLVNSKSDIHHENCSRIGRNDE